MSCSAKAIAVVAPFCFWFGAGCSEESRAPRSQPAPAPPGVAPPGPAPMPVQPAVQTPDASVPVDAAPVRPVSDGRDFIEEARMLYRVVACAGTAPVPPHLDARVVDVHCKRMAPRKAQYQQRYGKTVREFIAALRPQGLPSVVVYPFGGGDLISALVAFPDAVEITTLSLEHAGDPRRIRALTVPELQGSLEALSLEIGGMLSVSSNTSKNLSDAHQNLLPGQLSSFLIGLAVHGYEPVRVRYFTLEDSGAIRYLGEAEIEAMDQTLARQLKHDWAAPNFSPAFSNVEIEFRPVGAAPDAPVRVHRHIAANLADVHLAKNPAVLAHLRAKGRVAAMTKGASYLLWRPEFSAIRDYLLASMAWMLSDSTGIPPRFARQAGMKQTTYGFFYGSFLGADETHNEDFRALWASQPRRRLPFRFGYVDASKRAHLLVTEPAAPAAP